MMKKLLKRLAVYLIKLFSKQKIKDDTIRVPPKTTKAIAHEKAAEPSILNKKNKYRKSYVKQINKNMYYLCLEYGRKTTSGFKDMVLGEYRNLGDAIKEKNIINNKVNMC